MLYSMTGFGRATATVDGYTIVAEIRSLNGKGLDLSLRLPSALRALEAKIRRQVSEQLERGTVDLGITLKSGGSSRPMRINQELAAHYYAGIQQLTMHLQLPATNVLETLLGLPEVVTAEAEELPEAVLTAVLQVVTEAADALMDHRQTEGQTLEADLRARIAAISDGQAQTAPLEAPRTQRIRQKLMTSLEEIGSVADKVDANRLEQEMIYYFEKLDFSEEKTRLSQHCRYFLELLDNGEKAKGKKLGFVLQEVGREVNTMGSKANDAAIQKIVVGMKDELEKAKEQVLNVL